MEVHNLDSIPGEYIRAETGGALTKRLSALAGSHRLNVSLDVLAPGSHSAKYHAHSRQEEFFLILRGGRPAFSGADAQADWTPDPNV